MSFGAALALHQQGKLAEAERLYREILREQPGHADALHLLGVVALQAGQPQTAVDLIGQSLQTLPRQPVACLNRGVAYQQLNRREQALECFDRALQFAPDYVDALTNRANVLLELQRPEEALRSLDRALQLQPDFPLALNSRGTVLRSLQRPEEALHSYEQALLHVPDSPELLANCGNALADLQRYEEALERYDRALLTLPDPEIFRNRGDALLALQRADEALRSYEEALRLRPMHPDALFSAGMSLVTLGRTEAAQGYFQRLRELDPEYPYARGYQLFTRWRTCDWTDAERYRRELVSAVSRGAKADAPFSFLAVSDSAEAQLQCARTFVADRYPERAAARVPPQTCRHERIRLAYVSGDLRNHIVSRLLVGVFERHDRQRFEVTAIALRPADNHPFGQRVHAAFDRFVDVTRLRDAEVAALMQSMEIDIAIDLAGFTEGQRTAIFARRAAPVQVNYLGFPGTLGAPYIDYIIGDRFVIPPASGPGYAERVVWLPDCFHPTDDRRSRPARPSRTGLGLPGNALVCCSLNNNYKYNERMLDIWARLLLHASGSVLWLLADDAATESNLRREATRRGVSADRLIFSRRAPYEEHLARLVCADLFLDTLPFNAGATASDVLFAGVPLLTCVGEAFAARMAGSLLQAVGLPELVTYSLEEYERRALELVTAPTRLGELRRQLEAARQSSPLFDTAGYCRNLEAAYEVMWERSQRGEPPAPIAIQTAPPLPQAAHV
jgi:protein O-GlcNAc transferase